MKSAANQRRQILPGATGWLGTEYVKSTDNFSRKVENFFGLLMIRAFLVRVHESTKIYHGLLIL
jgi:hypothetical protein